MNRFRLETKFCYTITALIKILFNIILRINDPPEIVELSDDDDDNTAIVQSEPVPGSSRSVPKTKLPKKTVEVLEYDSDAIDDDDDIEVIHCTRPAITRKNGRKSYAKLLQDYKQSRANDNPTQKISSTVRKPFANGRRFSTPDYIEVEDSDDDVRFVPMEKDDPFERYDDTSLHGMSQDRNSLAALDVSVTSQLDITARANSTRSSCDVQNATINTVWSENSSIAVEGSSRREAATLNEQQAITIDDSEDEITFLDEVPAKRSKTDTPSTTQTGQLITRDVKSELLMQNISQTQTDEQRRTASQSQFTGSWHRPEIVSPESGCSPPTGQIPVMIVGNQEDEVGIVVQNLLPEVPGVVRRRSMVEIFDAADLTVVSPVVEEASNQRSIGDVRDENGSQRRLPSSASSPEPSFLNISVTSPYQPASPTSDHSAEVEPPTTDKNAEHPSETAPSENIDVLSQLALLRQQLFCRRPQALNEKPTREPPKASAIHPAQISLPGTPPESQSLTNHDVSIPPLECQTKDQSVGNTLSAEQISKEISETVAKMASGSKSGKVARTWGVSTSVSSSKKSENGPKKKIMPFGKDRNVGGASKSRNLDTADNLFSVDPQEKHSKIVRNVEKILESSNTQEAENDRMDTSTPPILLSEMLKRMMEEEPTNQPLKESLQTKSSNKKVVEQGETSRKELNSRRRSMSSGKRGPKTKDKGSNDLRQPNQSSVTLDCKLVDKCLSAFLDRQKMPISTPEFDKRREAKFDAKFIDKT